MITSSRRQKLQDKIDQLTKQLEELNVKPAPLTRKSEGFEELINQLNHVISVNNSSAEAVIGVLLKVKRTGLVLVKKD